MGDCGEPDPGAGHSHASAVRVWHGSVYLYELGSQQPSACQLCCVPDDLQCAAVYPGVYPGQEKFWHRSADQHAASGVFCGVFYVSVRRCGDYH